MIGSFTGRGDIRLTCGASWRFDRLVQASKTGGSDGLGTPAVASSRLFALRLSRQDAWVADNPADFAGAILALLNDATLRSSLGLAGRAYVEKNHDWDRVAAQLERIYEHVIKTRQGAEVVT
jgi:glycosyltransferase involved in cell wall biosynthesis